MSLQHSFLQVPVPVPEAVREYTVCRPIVGYFYKQYILGQPQEVASILAKLSAGATFVNAIVSTILVVIIYNAVRPALIKANLIHVYVTAANAK